MSNRNQDLDTEEIETINEMIAGHSRRSREESDAIGEKVHKHLKRKNLRQGELERYCFAKFGNHSDYLKRFENVYLGRGLFADADALQVAENWPNPYPTEPHRSSNLLSWYRKKLREAEKHSQIAQTRFDKTALLQTETSAWLEILVGDCRARLCGLPSAYCQAGVTSIPYHGEFDYSMPGQIGLEETISEYIRTLVVDVFRPFYRVLRDDGILWVVVGDRMVSGTRAARTGWNNRQRPDKSADDLPSGNMARIPQRLEAAMVNDGWIYRREVIIQRPGTLQNNQGYQPNQTHYKCLMFVKKLPYYYDRDAVLEPTINSKSIGNKARRDGRMTAEIHDKVIGSVWLIASDPSIDDRIPSFPVELVTRLMLLSTRPGDRVIDMFSGAGTVGLVAQRLGRKFTLIEINPEFAAIAEKRIVRDDPQPIDTFS
jgi:site-specific DNA-methyltransferase (cytosine-N4-specific)